MKKFQVRIAQDNLIRNRFVDSSLHVISCRRWIFKVIFEIAGFGEKNFTAFPLVIVLIQFVDGASELRASKGRKFEMLRI